MAWTTPMTATSNQTFTAAQWNTHVRDNFAELENAHASTAGRYIMAKGANDLSERAMYVSYNTNVQSTTSTSYADLATAGPSITVGTDTTAVLYWMCSLGNDTASAEAYCSVDVSGASTVAASDAWAIKMDGISGALSSGTDNVIRMGMFHRFTGLTAGNNTFKLKYRVSAGTGRFGVRTIQIMTM